MTERTHRLIVTGLVVVPLLSTLGAMVLLWKRMFFVEDLILLGVFYVLTGIGVTIGYHRMLTHQSFEAPAFLRGLLLIFGCMAFEGPPVNWASTHIKHHAHSDTEEDPHSPLEGFWYAHLGWLFVMRDYAEEERIYGSHLLHDKVVMFVDRFALLWMILSIALPGLIGGWTGLLWAGFVRVFLVNHVTWSVNSVCHSFGRRPFATTDESRNEWVVGLLAFGEGWHNNHHAFPSSAFHGLRWWQFDSSGILIRLWERLGLVWNVKRVSEEQMAAKLKKGETLREAFREYQQFLGIHVAQAQEELRIFARSLLPTYASVETASHRRSRIEKLQERYADQLEQLKKRMLQRTSLPKRMREASSAEVRVLVEQAKTHLRDVARVGAPGVIA